MKNAQTALISVVYSIKYLATRTLALRGHADNEGNLYELLQFRTDDVLEVKVWLKRKKQMAFEVLKQLNSKVKEDQYFSLFYL